ncbi:MAG: cob(I)yrinic acid a,c-diamide adenosyltransferase [candidate division WS1 bacterium]|jgi:cob(I)alamin adenosyltransferase|nr:cob(I)yrinic acid a,c-diamide adenosyltransferase [candidate division WS1 bacterium]
MTTPRHGLLHVYTGNGKGKTTAALGAVWRALGAGLRVCVVQFLKGGVIPSERAAASHFAPQLTFLHTAHPFTEALMQGHPEEEDRRYARRTWEQAQAALRNETYDLVVLDEIDNTLHLGLLPLEEVLAALRGRPTGQEVICTGRHAPAELMALADLVTEMVEVKHPYAQGLGARKGFEI